MNLPDYEEGYFTPKLGPGVKWPKEYEVPVLHYVRVGKYVQLQVGPIVPRTLTLWERIRAHWGF